VNYEIPCLSFLHENENDICVQAFDNQLRQKQIEIPFELKKPIPL